MDFSHDIHLYMIYILYIILNKKEKERENETEIISKVSEKFNKRVDFSDFANVVIF